MKNFQRGVESLDRVDSDEEAKGDNGLSFAKVYVSYSLGNNSILGSMKKIVKGIKNSWNLDMKENMV